MARAPHHYIFAHQVMKHMALSDPARFLAILASEHARDFISDMFNAICEKVGAQSPEFAASDIRIHGRRVGGFPCAVIEMPEPKETAEAFFTATVLLADGQAPLPEGRPLPARYFTLEKGYSFERRRERTVLCEWTTDSHLNCGDGPPATVDDFCLAIQDLLKRSR